MTTLPPKAEALLSDIHTIYCTASAVRLRGWTAHQMAHQVEGMVEDHLPAIIAEARAPLEADMAELRRAIAMTTQAFEEEVARLREAMRAIADRLERYWLHGDECESWAGDGASLADPSVDDADCDCGIRDLYQTARAALAATPVAPAPAATERCAACGHETRFHAEGQCDCEGDGKAGLCPCPEPRP